MSKIEIELPRVLSQFLQNRVDAGFYLTVSDAVEDAVRRLYETDDDAEAAIRAALAPGVAEADAGIFYDGTIEDIIAEAKAARAKRK